MTVRRHIDAHEAIRAMNEISMTPTPLTGACWHDGAMYLRLSGPTAVIEPAASKIEGELLGDDAPFWMALREQNLPIFETAQDLWRFSVRPNTQPMKQAGDWLIDWSGAQRWLTGKFDRDELEQFATNSGGEVSRTRGGDRSAELLPSLSDSKRALLLRMKQAFDPAGVFNPGRLYSWM